MTLLLCLDCGVEKPADEFPRNKNRSSGRAPYCTPCSGTRQRRSVDARRLREGRPPVVPREPVAKGHARCPQCGEVKPLDDFPRNRSSRTGRGGYCKPCHNERGRLAKQRLYGGTRDYHLRERYGITSAEVDALVEGQGGLCALCRERPPQHVDHDHLTGTVRGVLCSGCNQGLGNFRDDAAALERAAAYLRRTTWQKVRQPDGGTRLLAPRPDPVPAGVAPEVVERLDALFAAARVLARRRGPARRVPGRRLPVG